MAKAVLVMDMPEHCMYCPCNYDDVACMVGENVEDLDFTSRPVGCPLIPKPERYDDSAGFEEWTDNYFAKGWNACLGVLEGD